MIIRTGPEALHTWREVPVDPDALLALENDLDPGKGFADNRGIRLLGNGRHLAVFETQAMPGVALKRLPTFESSVLRAYYRKSLEGYYHILKQLGLPVVGQVCVPIDNRHGESVLYIAQHTQPDYTIGHRVIGGCTDEQAVALVECVLESIVRVWFRNKVDEPTTQSGLDPDISNWSFRGGDGTALSAIYLDTATPLFWRVGQDMSSPEIFLTDLTGWAVSSLGPGLRERTRRFYDLRSVLVTFVSGLPARGEDERLSLYVDAINRYAEAWSDEFDIPPITLEEVHAAADSDRSFWRRYRRAMRRGRYLRQRVRGHRCAQFAPEFGQEDRL